MIEMPRRAERAAEGLRAAPHPQWVDAIEFPLDKLKQTKSNGEFFDFLNT
ncbi:MAG TPA: hypothetical protein VHG92_14315 [Afifellaceae bacterium]|nr:hypothetical protein [Afifellaceae bacterium]